MFVGFKQTAPPHPADTTFAPFNIGLDHIATACEDATKLHRVAAALQAAGVENTGVKTDSALQKVYVASKDPDRIAWEFYMV
ncbi:VOC family protein [Hymenobacter nivis]|uniref:VOC family protein n=1 Tax=Hymenobacter nivis TaxID=1850093 RepID=UPI001B8660D2|nr:VOC family protein [Hymenobacter nivis]